MKKAVQTEVEKGKIEPRTREVRIVPKGPLRIAVPIEEGPCLATATVEHVLRKIRQRGVKP